MPHVAHRQPTAPTLPRSAIRRRAVDELHEQCGVYTRPNVVSRILDRIGWCEDVDLSRCRLLEPAAGDGAFVKEAACRLIRSCRAHNIAVTAQALKDCIRAFEIHPREARRARKNVSAKMHELGVHNRTSDALAGAWIKNADFLISQSDHTFTHVVGNPPYVRWKKLPAALKKTYVQRLPQPMIGGDLFLPILDRALDQLRENGTCGFLCSDRWRFTRYAESFRQKWLPDIEVSSEERLAASEAFVRDVDAYPTILIARRRTNAERVPTAPAIGSGRRLCDFGFRVRVGPALGYAPAFVLEPDEGEVEPELLHPWLDPSEVHEGKILWRGRRVIALNDDQGNLIDLAKFPLVMQRFRRFKTRLQGRSIVLKGAPWFRSIDRVIPAVWAEPKLLIPEIAKVPRVSLDLSGAIPSHGVYAIFAPGQKIDSLYEELAGGGLARALEGLAPKIKGGYMRCYKRFLEQIVL